MTKKKDIGFFLILGLLIISAAVSWNLYFKTYHQHDTVSIHTFPKEIGEWKSEELPISKDDLAILETENAFVRRYFNDKGQEVFLFIVYSQNNRKVSHPPEICYTGAGMEILDRTHESVSSEYYRSDIGMERLTAEKGSLRQLVFYWFKVGDTFTSSYWKQQGLIALKTFLGKPASSAMIRVSVDVKSNDYTSATAAVKSFVQVIIPHLQKHLE